MERLKRNPAAWGSIVGALAVIASSWLVWFKIEVVATGAEDTVRGLNGFTGQTVALVAVLVVICAFGVLGSFGKGRIVWASVGLVLSVGILVTALVGLFSPATIAARFVGESTVAGYASTSAVQAGLDSSQLTASAGVGLIVTAAGGVLAVAGAFLSFRKPVRSED